MNNKTLEQAIDTTQRYVQQYYPTASLVLLCGSWARHYAHEDSDIDLFVVDEAVEELRFAGVLFDTWLIEVCALAPQRIEELFAAAAYNRSAPVPHQVVDGMVIRGKSNFVEQIQALARNTLAAGPLPLTDAEIIELRWTLTMLLHDLRHVSAGELPALAAQCYTQFAQAAIDSVSGWHGDRKTLRRALIVVEPEYAAALDDALIAAIHGDRQPLLTSGHQVLERFGGSLRTYLERY
ncbi:MAG: nucleotidyltransferase domain-containing protein [Caldilineaceae bacterium]|nr:nucleotidyltransferase domain-containing protein [Caldilineaceae bacterium]MCB0121274.1 nucleotidyltransferase domain-containing protein [Caldilineaceae bacterium]